MVRASVDHATGAAICRNGLRRTRLGAGMPVAPALMDAGTLCRELYDEFRTAHPAREMRSRCDGGVRPDDVVVVDAGRGVDDRIGAYPRRFLREVGNDLRQRTQIAV